MPRVGDRLVDRYRIVAPLGSGGMATVWRAHDERLDRDVAIKVLLPNLAADPTIARRFEDEARSMAAIAHPGLVAVFDVDAGDETTGQEPFVVMELCPGGSLADRLAAGRMPPDELVPIVVAVADALAALHRAGLVHRDVKPANILFAVDRVKLGDFGLARPGGDGPDPSATGLTEPGTAIGTLAYLSPERLHGAPAGPAADVYALATVAFLGLTGSLPRPTASIRDAVAGAALPPPAVSAVAPALGAAFDTAVGEGLAIDPAERPDPLAFGSAMAAALGRWARSGRPGAVPVVIGGAPAAAAGADSGAGAADTTAMAIPTTRTTAFAVSRSDGATAASARDRPTRGAVSTGGRLVVGASLALAVLLAIALIAALRSGPVTPSDATDRSTAAASAASTAPSPRAAPSSSPAPSTLPEAPAATATPDPALAALDAMERAIAAAKGGPDGLKGRQANELEARVGRIRADLEDGDRRRALRDGRELERRVDDLAEDVDDEVADRLRDAAEALVAALGG